MPLLRFLILGTLIAFAGLTTAPVQAETPAAKSNATTHPGADASDWNGTGGLYRVIATSTGVLIGAGAMSLVIDGWVTDIFMHSGNLTAAEAIEIVQDMESQGGFEAAAVLLSGLAGGLVADNLYLKGLAVLPGTLDSLSNGIQPPLEALNKAWIGGSGWVLNRTGDISDWTQARSRELWDRWQVWSEQFRAQTPPAPTR